MSLPVIVPPISPAVGKITDTWSKPAPKKDTNAIASSAPPHSKRRSVLAVKDGCRGRSTPLCRILTALLYIYRLPLSIICATIAPRDETRNFAKMRRRWVDTVHMVLVG
jgi:hypothetical protein